MRLKIPLATNIKVTTIKKRREFLITASEGNKAIAKSLILFAKTNQANDGSILRVGFTVSKKVGNAVVRNKVKRRLKAVARQTMVEYSNPEMDYVIIARKEAFERNFNDLIMDLKYTLKKCGALLNNKY